MEDIKRARDLNPPRELRELVVPSNLQVPSREFEAFYGDDDQWNSVKSYVVGAALFWKLVKLPINDVSPIDDGSRQQSLSDEVGALNRSKGILV